MPHVNQQYITNPRMPDVEHINEAEMWPIRFFAKEFAEYRTTLAGEIESLQDHELPINIKLTP